MSRFTPDKSITELQVWAIPLGTTEIDLSNCTRLTSLFPPSPFFGHLFNRLRLSPFFGLTHISLTGCTNLSTLPENLPASLTHLFLSGCTNLTVLPELAAGLTHLTLDGCTRLIRSPDLIASLTTFEQRNAENIYSILLWPDHIDRSPGITALKQLLSTAYRSYYASDTNLAGREPTPDNRANYPTLTLIHRYMTESLGPRGGLEAVIGSVRPFAEAIAENPSLLKFIDPVSSSYLEACVNQPVAGFTQVANLINVANQPTILSKLEATKAVLAIDFIRQEVTRSGVGGNVQVELANAMLREVHLKLLSDGVISQPWPGIPQGVAYEGTVTSHLTAHNIERITNSAKKDWLEQPITVISDAVLAGTLREFWNDIVMRDEKGFFDDAIKPVLAKKAEITGLDGDAEDYDEKLGELSKQLKELEDVISGKVASITTEAAKSAVASSETSTGPSTSIEAFSSSSVAGGVSANPSLSQRL